MCGPQTVQARIYCSINVIYTTSLPELHFVCVCVCVCREKRADTTNVSQEVTTFQENSKVINPPQNDRSTHMYMHTNTGRVMSTLLVYLSCTLDFSRVSISCLYFLWSLSESCLVSIKPRTLL